MARYIQAPQQQYVSQYVPKDLNFYQQQIDKSQARYDATQAMYSEALAKLYEVPTLDPDSRNKMINQFVEGFDKTYDKYQGDLSRATGDVLGLVSTARKDPFWQLNQYQVDQAKIEQQAKLAGKLIVNSPSNKKIIDPETGQYTNTEALTTIAVDRPKYDELDRMFISQLRPDVVSYIETIENDPAYQGMSQSRQIEYKKELTARKVRELAGKYAKAYGEYISNAQYEDNPYFRNLYNNPQAITEHLTSMATPSIFSEITEKPVGGNRNGIGNTPSNTGSPIPRGRYLNWEENPNAGQNADFIKSNLDKYTKLQQDINKTIEIPQKSGMPNNVDGLKQNIITNYNNNPVAGKVDNIKNIPLTGFIDYLRKDPIKYKQAFDLYKVNNPNSYLLDNLQQDEEGNIIPPKNLEFEHQVINEYKHYLQSTDNSTLVQKQKKLQSELSKDPMFTNIMAQGASLQEAGEAIIKLQQELRLVAPTSYTLNTIEAEKNIIDELTKSPGLVVTPINSNTLGAISKGKPLTFSSLASKIEKIEYVPSSGTFIGQDAKGKSYEISGQHLTEVPKDWLRVGKEVFSRISSTTPKNEPIVSRYAITVPKQNLDALMGEDTGELSKALYPGYVVSHQWDKATNSITPVVTPILVGKNNKTITLDPIDISELSNSIMDNLINTYTYNPTRVPIKYN